MTDRVLMFTVRGEPCGQPRPRFANGHVYSTGRGTKAALWREAVARACRGCHGVMPSAWMERGDAVTPLAVEMVFSFKVTMRKGDLTGGPHTQKPDADNLAKLVLDVMQDSEVIMDDKQVSKLTVHKLWAPGQGVSVTVRPATHLGPVATHLDTEGLGSGGKPEWLIYAKAHNRS